jgi:two-component system chemotaxis response regulator CheB
MCRSALYELKDKRVLRFRCRSGHAFSAESLLSGQSEAREFHLSSLFGALIEEVTLAKRMRVTPEFKEEREIADGLGARVGRLERQAVEVCDWLKETVGLVEPEPE